VADAAALWEQIRAQADLEARREPVLRTYLERRVISHATFSGAITHALATSLRSEDLDRRTLVAVCDELLRDVPDLVEAAVTDVGAYVARDPSCENVLSPLIQYKGFLAIQAQRLAHELWVRDRRLLARLLQVRAAEVFAVDIHPGARLGRALFIDHGTGVVVGETCVVEDNVSILQGVTLGGTGKIQGDRHPKVRAGVLLGAGAIVLGNIEVGAGSKVAAGSVVLQDVPPHCTVAGVPAQPVGRPTVETPSFEMVHDIDS
jgi:serine O-acetyltransferase